MPIPIEVPQRERWARVRFAIIGPLLAAPPPRRRTATCRRHSPPWQPRPGAIPSPAWMFGSVCRPSSAGITPPAPPPIRWRCCAIACAPTAGPSQVCCPPHARPCRHSTAIIPACWTAQLHRDNLVATLAGTVTPVPSYPSVRRYLKAHGMVRRATPKRDTAGALAARDRLEQREVRSFEVEHVSALWRMRSTALCAVGFHVVGQGT
ncbi:hypothetical protein BDD21_5567 [Thiocapsa rosea]|uniref:Uncharacterized protein n=1 Tax=Thiocapsa rosea TaxID=69360 RepID=A0A495UL83_9GAMM|nr:hypothetical protein BDD21_5567 [Thiocapsa rosea]